jgi:hypothetical protein
MIVENIVVSQDCLTYRGRDRSYHNMIHESLIKYGLLHDYDIFDAMCKFLSFLTVDLYELCHSNNSMENENESHLSSNNFVMTRYVRLL